MRLFTRFLLTSMVLLLTQGESAVAGCLDPSDTETSTGKRRKYDRCIDEETVEDYICYQNEDHHKRKACPENTECRADATGASCVAVAPMGINLESVLNYSQAKMFVDAVRTARAWGAVDKPEYNVKADGSMLIPTDYYGWPTEDFGVYVFSDLENAHGTYQMTFQGQADVTSRQATIRNKAYVASADTTVAEIAVPQGVKTLTLVFKNTRVANPPSRGIKWLRIIRPGYPRWSKEIFHKTFLDLLKPFKVIRYMDFLGTNGNPVRLWKHRTRVEWPRQAHSTGVALEYAIILSNLTRKDMWINVPAMANDNYVRGMAETLKAHLDPRRKIYVEYSNEVWNYASGFPQFHYNMDQAVIDHNAGDRTLCYDHTQEENKAMWGHRRVARRIIEIGEIFKSVFGADQMLTRIRPVFATHVSNPGVAKNQLAYMQTFFGPINTKIWAIAGAPYFAADKALANNPNTSITTLMNALKNSVEGQIRKFMPATFWNGSSYKANYVFGADQELNLATIARRYGVKYFAYEGGQHLEGEENIDLKIQANEHSKMKQLVERYLSLWYGCGNDLFMWFSLTSRYHNGGFWGLVKTIENKNTAKYNAILSIKSKDPATFKCQ